MKLRINDIHTSFKEAAADLLNRESLNGNPTLVDVMEKLRDKKTKLTKDSDIKKFNRCTELVEGMKKIRQLDIQNLQWTPRIALMIAADTFDPSNTLENALMSLKYYTKKHVEAGELNRPKHMASLRHDIEAYILTFKFNSVV